MSEGNRMRRKGERKDDDEMWSRWKLAPAQAFFTTTDAVIMARHTRLVSHT
jgi:hypothetical protein